jgi:hypothetical protein
MKINKIPGLIVPYLYRINKYREIGSTLQAKVVRQFLLLPDANEADALFQQLRFSWPVRNKTMRKANPAFRPAVSV